MYEHQVQNLHFGYLTCPCRNMCARTYNCSHTVQGVEGGHGDKPAHRQRSKSFSALLAAAEAEVAGRFAAMAGRLSEGF